MNTILIIDDNKDFTSILKIVLEMSDFIVHTANDALKGIEKAKDLNPDLIILDIIMPKIDGPKALEILKADPNTANIPAIFLTGLASNENDPNGIGEIELGNVKYKTVEKPFDNEALIELIKSTLKEQQ